MKVTSIDEITEEELLLAGVISKYPDDLLNDLENATELLEKLNKLK